ncbi:hypothetical protein LJR231_005515 [Phyllobacterium sp. LjRoot231]|uniref:hypothetical protein n=1 Tax=Phyllobacterium sp. LjRoot231 TaxID=3342289 RepID=UPI003ECDD348
MRKSLRQKNIEQKLRQRSYRERLKRERKPSRDDCARALLHTYFLKFAEDKEVAQDAIDGIVKKLVRQGFAEEPCYEVLDSIVTKYSKGKWQFRRKPHLFGSGMCTSDG